MGMAALPVKASPLSSPEEHAAFMKKWGLMESGPHYTARKRSRAVMDALLECPEVIAPELRYRQRK